MKKFFGILLMLVSGFVLSVDAVPKGSPPLIETQMVTVQTVVTVDQVVNFVNFAIVDVGFNYCVEKQSIKTIYTKTFSTKSHVGYFYTDKDYGSRWVETTNSKIKYANWITDKDYGNRFIQNISWSIGGCTNLSPPIPSFTNPIIT